MAGFAVSAPTRTSYPTWSPTLRVRDRQGRAGQCVIGHSMFYIEKHKGVIDKIQTVCRQDLKQAELDRPRRNVLLSRLAMQLEKQARYTIDESGDLTIAIDENIMRKRLSELMEEQAESGESEA